MRKKRVVASIIVLVMVLNSLSSMWLYAAESETVFESENEQESTAEDEFSEASSENDDEILFQTESDTDEELNQEVSSEVSTETFTEEEPNENIQKDSINLEEKEPDVFEKKKSLNRDGGTSGNISMLSLGSTHSAAITKDGSLYMWGDNYYGELGNGTVENKSKPIKVMKNVKSVSLGGNHSGVITTDGSLYTWGYNASGKLGNGTLKDSAKPIKVMDNVETVSLGFHHSGAITTDGSLYMWGDNFYGQLGNGTVEDSSEPKKILDNVQSVSLGSYHSGAITTDGSLYMWGWNSNGELGNGSAEDSYRPIKIMDNVKSISLGGAHSAAITTDGSLYMWGANSNGELGNGTVEEIHRPIKIMENVESVSLGTYNSGAVSIDGSMYIWGKDFTSDSEDGLDYEKNIIPKQIMNNVGAVSLGCYHNGLLTTSGSLYMWGWNYDYQLGNDTTKKENSPILIQIGDDDDPIIEDEDIPIIIVPGIMGSNLYTPTLDYKIWGPNMDDLYFVPGITANYLGVDSYKKLEVKYNDDDLNSMRNKEYGVNNSYRDLVNTLCDNFPDRPIYFFSYDWRLSNVESARDLNKQINVILDKHGGEKVDIVAHSMGGLVTSLYVENNGTAKTNKIITCGTPYEGAPLLLNRALGRAATGEIIDPLMYMRGLQEDIKTKFPALAELIPNNSYYNSYKWVNDNWEMLSYVKFSNICRAIFGGNFIKAQEIHTKMKTNNDNFYVGHNILYDMNNTYFIVGKGQITCKAGMIVENSKSKVGYACEDLFYENNGDGTVPYLSATMSGELNEIGNDAGGNSRYLEINTDHGGTVKHNKALRYIVETLGTSGSFTISDGNKKTSYVVAKAYCPVEVSVSKDGEELNSSIDKLAMNSSFGTLDFCGIDGDIKVFCLEDAEYSVKLNGTDSGYMDLVIEHYDENGECVQERRFLDIPLTDQTTMTTVINNKSETVLIVDSNGDGENDQKWTVGDGETAKVEDMNKKYNITFNPNGGKTTTTSKTVTQNLTYGTLPIPTRIGYSFRGWYTSKTGGTKITLTSKVMITSDQTLYAQWEKVNVKKPKISKLTNKKSKKVTVKIKKVSGAEGYQILYSTNKKFKRTKKTKMTAKNSLTIKNLKKGKVYYFKVRAYKSDSTGAKVYGKYSTKKKILIKK